MPISSVTVRLSNLIIVALWAAGGGLMWWGAAHGDEEVPTELMLGVYVTTLAAATTVCASIRIATVRVLAQMGRPTQQPWAAEPPGEEQAPLHSVP